MANSGDVEAFMKRKMDEFLVEWLDLPATQTLIDRVLGLSKEGSISSKPPSSPMLNIPSSMRGGANLDDEVLMAPLPFFSVPMSPTNMHSPPLSPRPMLSPTSSTSSSRAGKSLPLPQTIAELIRGPTSPPRSPSQLASQDFWVDETFTLPPDALSAATHGPTSPVHAKTGAHTPMMVGTPCKKSKEVVPPFYTPPRKLSSSLSTDEMAVVDKLFASGPLREYSQLAPVLKTHLRVSRYFAEPLFRKLLERTKSSNLLYKQDFIEYWRENLVLGDGVSNFFHIVKSSGEDYLTRADFREFLWSLLDHHPGLAFLHESPEFQERYADTVICRIFYHYDYRQVGRIFLRDLGRSRWLRPSITKAWLDVDETDDINAIRDYFSYEHFYVLYCKFWDLDSDHDFLLDREDLSSYDGHAYSPRALDRLFEQVGMRFSSAVPGKMNYDDFVWFILSDEDKTTPASLEFFFALLDLDGDGVIRDHEMFWFYEDQIRRLEGVGQDAPAFADIMCQMNDLIRPDQEGQFKLENFLRRRKQNAGALFSVLISLNKFMGFEQRDPFQIKQDMMSNPELSDWDRFCAAEYVRLAMEASGNTQTAESDAFLRNADGVRINGVEK